MGNACSCGEDGTSGLEGDFFTELIDMERLEVSCWFLSENAKHLSKGRSKCKVCSAICWCPEVSPDAQITEKQHAVAQKLFKARCAFFCIESEM